MGISIEKRSSPEELTLGTVYQLKLNYGNDTVAWTEIDDSSFTPNRSLSYTLTDEQQNQLTNDTNDSNNTNDMIIVTANLYSDSNSTIPENKVQLECYTNLTDYLNGNGASNIFVENNNTYPLPSSNSIINISITDLVDNFESGTDDTTGTVIMTCNFSFPPQTLLS